MYINHNRINAERNRWQAGGDYVSGDCGVCALAAVAHIPYAEAMRVLRGHKAIFPKLKQAGCNGFRFIAVYGGRASNAKAFAKRHPEGRFILYCGGSNHHYVPCVHGEVWNDASYMKVTSAYLAVPAD